MSTAVEAEKAVVVEQHQQSEAPVAASKSKKKAKVPKEKKPKSAKTASHPPYFQMIKDALLSLKDRTGSSPQAIAKSIEEKYKSALPATFRKVLGLQLKSLSSKGKLVKIKASYKLSDAGKKVDAVKKPAVANAEKKTKAIAAKPEKKNVGTKAATKKPEAEMKKVAAAKPVKKAVQTKKRAAPAAKPKQPKSIKSPAAKKAKKGGAAA